MKRIVYLVAVLLSLAAFAPTQSNAAELVFFYAVGCPVCARWDKEVGSIYDKTDEAKRLPLRRQDLHKKRPADLTFIKGVVFTPTFVLVEDGKELGRIVGYVSDYFFWGQIDGLIKTMDIGSKTPVSASQ